jgi:hypothetical protein
MLHNIGLNQSKSEKGVDISDSVDDSYISLSNEVKSFGG